MTEKQRRPLTLKRDSDAAAETFHTQDVEVTVTIEIDEVSGGGT